MVLHIAERRVEEAVGQPQAQRLQDRVGHRVRHAGRQAEEQNFDGIGQQRQQAPLYNSRRRSRSHREQTQHCVHAVKRRKPRRHAEHGQNDRQVHPLFLALRVGEEHVHPTFLFFILHIVFPFPCGTLTASNA